MTELAAHIPTEATVPFFGTIDVHWEYHALLMTFVWLGLVPLCIIIMRFHKPPPSPKGIVRDVRVRHPEWWFFTVHKFGLFFAMMYPFIAYFLIWGGSIWGPLLMLAAAPIGIAVYMGIARVANAMFAFGGAGPLRTPFPPDQYGLTKDDRIALQTRLSQRGFDTGGADGVLGPKTRAAITDYQRSIGVEPTGDPSQALLASLA